MFGVWWPWLSLEVVKAYLHYFCCLFVSNTLRVILGFSFIFGSQLILVNNASFQDYYGQIWFCQECCDGFHSHFVLSQDASTLVNFGDSFEVICNSGQRHVSLTSLKWFELFINCYWINKLFIIVRQITYTPIITYTGFHTYLASPSVFIHHYQ